MTDAASAGSASTESSTQNTGSASTPAPQGGDAGAQGQSSQGDASAANSRTRPDYVPEKFWNAETGGVRIREALDAYASLEKAMAGKLDPIKSAWEKDLAVQMRPKLMDELKLEHQKGIEARRPPTANDYQVKLPDNFLPKGVRFEVNENDPLMKFWRDHCFEQGYDNEIFNKGLQQYVSAELAKLPNKEAEMVKLGEKAQERLNRVNTWAKANLSDDSYKTLDSMVKTADGVKVLEELMAKVGGPSLSALDHASTSSSGKSLAEVKEMMKDPRYSSPAKRDPAYVAEVRTHFERLFPGETRTAY